MGQCCYLSLPLPHFHLNLGGFGCSCSFPVLHIQSFVRLYHFYLQIFFRLSSPFYPLCSLFSSSLSIAIIFARDFLLIIQSPLWWHSSCFSIHLPESSVYHVTLQNEALAPWEDSYCSPNLASVFHSLVLSLLQHWTTWVLTQLWP